MQSRLLYEQDALSKQDYINAIHASHQALFNYPEFLADTDVESLRILADGVYVRSRSQQVELLLDPQDQHLVPFTLMNFRHYEVVETEFLKRAIGPGAVVLDIGANCGWYSLALARHCPSARVHAFEPIPHTHEILVHNIRHNGLANITPHRLAFSAFEGELEFLHTPICSGATSLVVAGQPVSEARLQRINCPGTTLEHFCAQHGLAPSVIKCDVEGAELLVFQGGVKILAEHQPVILVELLRKWARQFGYHPNEVLELLSALGYRAYTLDASGLLPCAQIHEETRETNFVFLHPQAHRPLLSDLGL